MSLLNEDRLEKRLLLEIPVLSDGMPSPKRNGDHPYRSNDCSLRVNWNYGCVFL
jgi:hypothetical protein